MSGRPIKRTLRDAGLEVDDVLWAFVRLDDE